MVVQKGLFVLGGMVLPVVLYPNALRYVVEFLPFQAILYAPASFSTDHSIVHIVSMIGLQFAWIVICAGALLLMKNAFEKRLLHS